MFSDRVTARVVGVLFIIASVTSIIGGSLILPLEDSDPLGELFQYRNQVRTGVLFELILVVSVVAIAALLFPVLKRRNEGLAMGYVAARTLEAVVVLAGAATAMIAVGLSEPGTPTSALGVDALVAIRHGTLTMGTLILFGVGALVLYTILYRGRFVPRWLSLWGLIGAALILLRGVLELYGVEMAGWAQAVLAAPIGLNELVLAVWLIAKGFTAPLDTLSPPEDPSTAAQEVPPG
ncbi:MAG: DUF4386 domain-containing protein [Candidatus Nanopelagicales bacterium]